MAGYSHNLFSVMNIHSGRPKHTPTVFACCWILRGQRCLNSNAPSYIPMVLCGEILSSICHWLIQWESRYIAFVATSTRCYCTDKCWQAASMGSLSPITACYRQVSA